MLNETNIEARAVELSTGLQAEGAKCVFVAMGVHRPDCACGRPDCVGAMAIQFAGSLNHLREMTSKVLAKALTPDALADFGRALIEIAYNLQSPAHQATHRRRFRGGSQN